MWYLVESRVAGVDVDDVMAVAGEFIPSEVFCAGIVVDKEYLVAGVYPSTASPFAGCLELDANKE